MSQSTLIKYVLLFTDSSEFEVNQDFVMLSKFFRNVLDDLGTEEGETVIKLPVPDNWKNEVYKEVYSNYLKIVEKQADYFVELENDSDYTSPGYRDLSEVEKVLQFEPSQFSMLFEILCAVNLLDMQPYSLLLSKIIAHKINESRISGNDQEIYDILGNPEIELTEEQKTAVEQKVEILEALKRNEEASM
jgi:hypothetical protein